MQFNKEPICSEIGEYDTRQIHNVNLPCVHQRKIMQFVWQVLQVGGTAEEFGKISLKKSLKALVRLGLRHF